MKKFEIILGLTALVGIVLRLLDIAGGGPITVISLSTLATFYWALSFALFNGIRARDIFKKSSYSHTTAKRIVVAIGLGFILSNVVIGSMFKIQVWPGSDPLLKTGLAILGLILVVLLSRYFRNKTDLHLKAFHVRAIKRIVICGSLGLIIFLIPTSTFMDAFDIEPDETPSIEETTTANSVDEGQENQ
jgi:hypothetical protein